MADKPPPDDRSTDEFLTGAYGLDGLADALAFYARWADDYDQRMVERLGYIAPHRCAEHLARHVDDRSALVLDVGCGTGLTSHYLAELGFSRFDGIDISPEMLIKARERGIYGELIEADVTKPFAVAEATYDAAISSGTFTLGHVGSEPFDEIMRVLKPGAMFACTIHKDIWQPKGFAAKVSVLEAAGALRTVEVSFDEFFQGLESTAMYCMFQRL